MTSNDESGIPTRSQLKNELSKIRWILAVSAILNVILIGALVFPYLPQLNVPTPIPTPTPVPTYNVLFLWNSSRYNGLDLWIYRYNIVIGNDGNTFTNSTSITVLKGGLASEQITKNMYDTRYDDFHQYGTGELIMLRASNDTALSSALDACYKAARYPGDNQACNYEFGNHVPTAIGEWHLRLPAIPSPPDAELHVCVVGTCPDNLTSQMFHP